MSNTDVLIRLARLEDAASIAALLSELGYPASNEDAKNRLSQLNAATNATLVAEQNSIVIGFISIHLLPMIHASGLLGKVIGLVVTQQFRGLGVGKSLLKAAELFAKNNGAKRMEIISGNHRSKAHEFYRHLGYSATNQTRFVLDSIST